VSPPSLTSPGPGGTIAEGQVFSFSTPAAGSFGYLELSRPSDGFIWTLNFSPGTSQVRLPVLGLLGPGSYEWQVSFVGGPSVTYETLSALPSNARDGLAALDFFVVSDSRAVTVP